MKRIMLFLFTNLAVILILSIVLNILGVDRILDAQGIGLDMANLLVFAVVFGFGGSFIYILGDVEMDRQTDHRCPSHLDATRS